MIAPRLRLLFCVGLIVLVGCAGSAGLGRGRLPSYARPQVLDADSKRLSDDVIYYRALTRDDFRAAGPPEYLGSNARDMGAVTCAMIRVRGGAQFEFSSTPERVDVRAVDLYFEALMDRQCSWWNAENDAFPDDYVLEHEQVHLGIFEVEARRLTRRAGAAAVISAPPGTDPKVLSTRVRAIIERELEASKEAVLARSLSFDEDTSLGHEPELQRRWRETVERELKTVPR